MLNKSFKWPIELLDVGFGRFLNFFPGATVKGNVLLDKISANLVRMFIVVLLGLMWFSES